MRFLSMEELDRATGKTTRAVDGYIQRLFTERGIAHVVYDPFEGGLCKNANRGLVDRIVKRLKSEHPGAEVRVTWKGVYPYVQLLTSARCIFPR